MNQVIKYHSVSCNLTKSDTDRDIHKARMNLLKELKQIPDSAILKHSRFNIVQYGQHRTLYFNYSIMWPTEADYIAYLICKD